MAERPTMADLRDDELVAAGLALGRLAQELVAANYPRAARWARFEAHRIANELSRRANQAPDTLPSITTLSDLSRRELRRIADRVHVLATLEAAYGDDDPAARWWSALHRQTIETIENRDQSAEPLRRWLADRRRERPIGTPGDTKGIPSWRDVSSDDV